MKYLWSIALGASLSAIDVSFTEWRYWAVFIPVTIAMMVQSWSKEI